MATLATRLQDLITAIGTDIKSIKAQLANALNVAMPSKASGTAPALKLTQPDNTTTTADAEMAQVFHGTDKTFWLNEWGAPRVAVPSNKSGEQALKINLLSGYSGVPIQMTKVGGPTYQWAVHADGSMSIAQTSAPSAPAANMNRLYPKSDGKWYSKDSAGVETLIGPFDASSYAPLASPALTGNPTAPTQTAGNNSTRVATTAFVTAAVAVGSEVLLVALSDETTAITAGVAKVTMRMPFAMTLTAVRASLTVASSSGIPTVDINEGGATILSTKLTIDASELTSVTAAVPAVISDASLADDAEITFDIDVSGTGAKGLKVALIGVRS